MLVIRLTRFGRKKKPFYRIVVADSRAPIKGKYLEKIGQYNPLLDPPEIFVDKEKADKWLKLGATPSGTVWNLLVNAGILKKKIVTKRTQKKKEEKTKTPETQVSQKPKEEEEVKKSLVAGRKVDLPT